MASQDHPQRARSSRKVPGDPTTPDITARDLGRRVGRTYHWVLLMAREGLIPHVRVGPPPIAGRRDTRPVRFTPAQADEIDAMVNHVEHRPAGGAA